MSAGIHEAAAIGSFLKGEPPSALAISALLMDSKKHGSSSSEELRAKLGLTAQSSHSSHSDPGTVNEMTLRAKLSSDITLPTMLLVLLSDPRYHSIISWLPQGTLWRIADVTSFQSILLPVFFRELVVPNTMASFMEALKEWGFEVVLVEANGLVFFSEFFTRQHPILSLCMARTPRESETTPSFRALLQQQQTEAQAVLARDILQLLGSNLPVDAENVSRLLNSKPPPQVPALPTDGANLLHPGGLPSLPALSSERDNFIAKEQSLLRQIAEKEAQIQAATLAAVAQQDQTQNKAMLGAALAQKQLHHQHPQLGELTVAKLLATQTGATAEAAKPVDSILPSLQSSSLAVGNPAISSAAVAPAVTEPAKDGSLLGLLVASERLAASNKNELGQDHVKVIPKKRRGRKKWLPPLGPPALPPLSGN